MFRNPFRHRSARAHKCEWIRVCFASWLRHANCSLHPGRRSRNELSRRLPRLRNPCLLRPCRSSGHSLPKTARFGRRRNRRSRLPTASSCHAFHLERPFRNPCTKRSRTAEPPARNLVVRSAPHPRPAVEASAAVAEEDRVISGGTYRYLRPPKERISPTISLACLPV